MSFFFGRDKKRIPSNAAFRITQEGREKLQEFGGDPKSQILMALETGGTKTLLELSRTTGLSMGKLERIMAALAPVYVQYITGNMSDEEE